LSKALPAAGRLDQRLPTIAVAASGLAAGAH
jgi:hypothetical protein